ncbi:MAG: 50S ribosomal protein L10 [Candidatus Micrarchaeota archaeon]|nr:50S ribosomal protein L10 [Candidatus Micrarchaeota archaeon]
MAMKREEKIKAAQQLRETLKNYKSIILINLKKLPAQLQKKVRRKIDGFHRVERKPVINHALQDLGIEYEVDYPVLVIAVNEHPYRIEKILRSEQLPVSAKPGQVAEEDIIIEEMETDLPPGPALSALKQAGLDARVEKGKIKIAKTSVLAKKGEKLTPIKVQALQLLGIKPFKVRAHIAFAYDGVYYKPEHFKITEEEIAEDITKAATGAFNLALNANYPTPQTIEFLLQNAYTQAKNLATEANIYSPISMEGIIYKQFIIGNNIPKGDKDES